MRIPILRNLPYLILGLSRRLWRDARGAVFAEYLLLASLVGVGIIAGVAAVRTSMLREFAELVECIMAIKP